jgi:hypothetical protein
LRWKDPAANSKAQAVDKQNWYVFHSGRIGKWGPDDWDDNAFAKNNRIFGSRNIYLLYLHFNCKSAYLARYTITAKKKTPAYLLHLLSLLQLYGVNPTGGGQGTIVPNAYWDATKFDSYYVPSDLTFAPSVLPKPLTADSSQAAPSSAPVDPSAPRGPSAATAPPTPSTPLAVTPSTQTPAGPLAATSSSALPAESTAVPGANGQSEPRTSSNTQPSSVPAVQSQLASIPTELALDTQTFDNEGLYHVDFTVAVPIRKISEISYVSGSNTLVPSKIDKQTTFGLIDYYVQPVDIKSTGWSVYPHALAGVAIDSNPLKRVLVGGGYGPVLAHFYMGLVLDTQPLAPGSSCGSLPTAPQLASGTLRNRTCPGLGIGLNVSVGSVIDALKPKSATGSSKAK